MAIKLTTAQEADLQKFRMLTGHLTAPHTVLEWLNAKVRIAWMEWQRGNWTNGHTEYEAMLTLRDAYEPSDENYRVSQDEADAEAGAAAYRSPDSAAKRCPFKRSERRAAWLRGFNEQRSAAHH